MSATPVHTNRLVAASSPYLLQHAHNPVDWYSWGSEAFDAAQGQNKPIFLSVGYSSCYWCHVMERQCFENEQVAQVMNELFVSIKVDREERPDVDQLYMLAVQILTQRGGWPMSVFLTPNLRPFYGGTYFPPERFVPVLRAIADAYHNRHDDVEQSATQLVNILRQIAEPAAPDSPMRIDEDFIAGLVQRSIADYEPTYGGFGAAPKFPRETLLELVLVFCSQSAREDLKAEVLPKVVHTLDAMAAGGIRDQLGGGFHRYSTDGQWLIPHFEIMLYDNAMLAWIYAEAHRQTNDLRYADVAQEILDFLLREMRSPDGAFYSAYDAEVDAQEGLTYLWKPAEVEQVLGAAAFKTDEIEWFKHVYGLDLPPNFADPHHGTGRPDNHVLFLKEPGRNWENTRRAEKMRAALLAARGKRKQPFLDTKIITSWNALAIRGFALAGKVFGEARYLDAASRCAEYLLHHHRMQDGTLVRTSRPDVPQASHQIPAFLDDYAFFMQALWALHEATHVEMWREHAAAVSATMLEKFGDANGGFFFTEAGAADLIIRQKTASDSPLPSGNAVAAMAMLELDCADWAQATLKTFARQLRDQAEGMSSMVQAALRYVQRHGPIEVEASAGAQRPLSPEQFAMRVVSVRSARSTPARLDLHVKILEGFHLNAHEAGEGLIPTGLTIEGAEVSSIDYPAGEELRVGFAERPIRAYSGSIEISATFASPIPAGTTLHLRLTYQACDESACLPPVKKELEVRT